MSEQPSTSTTEATPAQTPTKMTNLIILGMAGSGKTTFVHRLASTLTSLNTRPYVINLDPACRDPPFPCNIDIRDTVNYKKVMKTYGLGPNGAIVTSLNLFATKFDQVINILSNKQEKFAIFDTPGQIEVFTWSASGTIIVDTLASQGPTVVVYVMDTARSESPTTFMSNMLYACSILYKTKLPFIVVLNKTDVKDCGFAKTWMRDFMSFDEAISGDTSYMASLTSSLSLVLDEFYKDLSCVGVSSVTGSGFEDFLKEVGVKEVEFEEYRVEYEKLKKEKMEEERKKGEKMLEKVKMDVGAGDEVVMNPLMEIEGERVDFGMVLGEGDES